MYDVPFKRSYWVIPRVFLAGYYPGPRDYEQDQRELRALLSHGVRYMVNLTEPNEQDWSGRPTPVYTHQILSIAAAMGLTVTVERMPIKDTWVPSRLEMCHILDSIDESIGDKKPVYVHCWGGRGRTGTVVGCYLVRHGLAHSGNVLEVIKALRKETPDHDLPSPETQKQVEFLLSWVEAE